MIEIKSEKQIRKKLLEQKKKVLNIEDLTYERLYPEGYRDALKWVLSKKIN